jgi:hypothetical protein
MFKTYRWHPSAILLMLCAAQATAAEYDVKGFSLTELGEFVYDANLARGEKTQAQQRVDQLHALGVRHINLHPRAVMRDPRGFEVIPVTPLAEKRHELYRYKRLMDYIHSQGMTVGVRPIFFVTDLNGKTPVIEVQSDGTRKVWWHGNIQPSDPNRWFDFFRTYLDRYLLVAKAGKADEFTIGAELYSMTVGIEDQWEKHPHGFPGEWLKILKLAKRELPKARIMYDINFTDASFEADGIVEVGGELARWKYRLADLADQNDKDWLLLKEFWDGLDAVGIDMYRSLATDNQEMPEDHDQLVAMLKRTSDRYAGQIDDILLEIDLALEADQPKPVMIKEIGFRSAEKSFVRPFEYAGGADALSVNIHHQAAAYQAVLESFSGASFEWFRGIVFWDASVSPNLHGERDAGFSPLGKKQSEDIVLRFFKES